MKTLLIVESPAKSKTIEKILGSDYIVLSSFGHIRNLDKNGLGIEIENNYRPIYKKLTDRSKQIKSIEETIKKVDRVLLASDEDREGEAIAWHCAIVFKLNLNDLNRICFHEITENALKNAVNNPRKIDMAMVNSQQARRVLDRLVGFKLSPLLWKYIAPKLSAGRVQSSALKILVDQETEIGKFNEKKFIKTIGLFSKKISANLDTKFEKGDDALLFLNDCQKAEFMIKSIDKKKVEKTPPPPYITSTIQQDIGSRFGIGSKQIMSILQKLYEAGLITYHRTDSTNLSSHIQDEIKKYILGEYGKDYLKIRNFKSKIKCAQEAHEAIRPTYINKKEIDGDFNDIEKKIYDIIWKRTVASQMSVCVSEVFTVSISISGRKEMFISNCEKIIFDGYKKVYDEIIKDDDNSEKDEPIGFIVDDIKEKDILKYIKITSSEKYQNPPGRYNESSLIKKLEKSGIGRPSTYASIMETIVERKYVEKKNIIGIKKDVKSYILEKDTIKTNDDKNVFGAEKKKLVPTDLGLAVNKFLESHFNNILDSNFTSGLEEKLDDIANNKNEWLTVVDQFYKGFEPNILKLNDKEMITNNNNDKKRLVGTDENGSNVYAYIARYGPVFQVGEGKSAKYVKIDSNYSVDKVTMDDFLILSKYPRIIGQYEGSDIILKKGMYGIYLSYNGKNFKILEDYDENIDIESAIKCINGNVNDTKTEANKGLIKKIDKYDIKNGPYGHYILYNKKFFSIPKTYDIDVLSKADCDVIIKLPKKIYKQK
jgi:DNA topoisomerase-1